MISQDFLKLLSVYNSKSYLDICLFYIDTNLSLSQLLEDFIDVDLIYTSSKYILMGSLWNNVGGNMVKSAVFSRRLRPNWEITGGRYIRPDCVS